MYNDKPLVSVVIPTYKRSSTLRRAIDSVLYQTYPNIEIIVVDDNGKASEDANATQNLLYDYISSNKIRYIQRDCNGGGAKSRNTGIMEAKGEYVAFLDDDDEYYPSKIELQYNLFVSKMRNNVGLIYCYVNGVNKEGKLIQQYNNDFEGIPLNISMQQCIAGTSTWFCSKQILLDINGFEDTPSKQDTILIMKLLAKGYSIYRVPECLVNYYEYNGNKISGMGENAIIGELNARNYARSLYTQLNSSQEQRLIEYNYSKKLIPLYLFNKRKKEALLELKNMLYLYPLKKSTFISIVKCMFSNMYIIFIKRINNKRLKV